MSDETLFDYKYYQSEKRDEMGQTLKAMRKSANLSQRDLAKIVGISPCFISQFECGYFLSKKTREKVLKGLKSWEESLNIKTGKPQEVRHLTVQDLETFFVTPCELDQKLTKIAEKIIQKLSGLEIKVTIQ